MGVRERKKQKLIHDILLAAGNLFSKKGYAKTTLEEVAEKADIGVGTLYNYFNSKADLFLTVMADELNFAMGNIDEIVRDSKSNSAALTLDFIWKSAKPLLYVDKEKWREVMAIAMGSVKTDNILLQRLINVDNQFTIQLEKCFNYQKEHAILPGDFPSDQAARGIYSIILAQFIFYIYAPEMTLDLCKAGIEEQVRFVLDGYKRCETNK